MSKVVVVTGAGTGIGKAVAVAFLRAGDRVALAGRRKELLDKAVAESGAKADQAVVVPTDVGDPAQVRALFARTKAAFGRLDVLFNNAGSGAPGVPLEDLTYEQWKAVVDVNLTGPFLCTQEAFRIMKDTKHGITGLTRSTSLDGRKYDIACGQIDIGNAGTEMTARMAKGVPQAHGAVEVEPLMDVAHVASAVLHMASMPLDANVQFMTVMATKMPFIGRG
jgi:NAD(P)-dependent dehydrogenase (short-subunit alcohol dehydrogenase family)